MQKERGKGQFLCKNLSCGQRSKKTLQTSVNVPSASSHQNLKTKTFCALPARIYLRSGTWKDTCAYLTYVGTLLCDVSRFFRSFWNFFEGSGLSEQIFSNCPLWEGSCKTLAKLGETFSVGVVSWVKILLAALLVLKKSSGKRAKQVVSVKYHCRFRNGTEWENKNGHSDHNRNTWKMDATSLD